MSQQTYRNFTAIEQVSTDSEGAQTPTFMDVENLPKTIPTTYSIFIPPSDIPIYIIQYIYIGQLSTNSPLGCDSKVCTYLHSFKFEYEFEYMCMSIYEYTNIHV